MPELLDAGLLRFAALFFTGTLSYDGQRSTVDGGIPREVSISLTVIHNTMRMPEQGSSQHLEAFSGLNSPLLCPVQRVCRHLLTRSGGVATFDGAEGERGWISDARFSSYEGRQANYWG